MLFIVTIIILIWILTITVTLRVSINSNLNEIMTKTIVSKTQVVNAVFDDFEEELSHVLFEYAEWDDTYKAFVNADSDWIQNNIVKYFSDKESYDLDLYFMKNDDGTILEHNVSGDLLDLFESSFESLFVDEYYSEFIRYNGSVYLVSASPVFSDETYEQNGFMVVGQIIDDLKIEEIFNRYYSDDFLRVETTSTFNLDITEKVRINNTTEYYIEYEIDSSESFYIFHSFIKYTEDGDRLFFKVHMLILIISVTIVTLLLLGSLYLMKMLKKLIGEIDNVARGDYLYKIDCFSSMELTNISKHINSLSSAVQHHIDELEYANLSSISLLVGAIEAKDIYTKGHSDRVMKMSLILAEDLEEVNIENLRIAAILHDIGKISIPERVLNKPGKLTDEEFDLVRSHPLRGYEILINSKYLESVRKIVLQHHERFDGRGYPNNLMGKDTVIEARVLQIIDTFDAITSDRPYRKGRTIDEAVEIIISEKDKQFDGTLVDIFISKLEKIKLLCDKKK